MNRYILLLIISIQCMAGLSALAQKIFIQEYSADEHKGSSQNWDISQDTRGVIYIANTDGLVIFDGAKWSLVNLPNNQYVSSVSVDSAGRIYVGSVNEFGFFQNGGKGKYTYHSLMPLANAEHRSSLMEIVSISIIDGSVFFCSDSLIYIYEGGKVRVWAGANRGVVNLSGVACTFDEKNFFLYRNGSFQNVRLNLPVDDIRNIKQYGDQWIVLSGRDRIWKVNGLLSQNVSWTLFSSHLHELLKSEYIYKMAPIANDNLAILTYNDILIVNANGDLLYTISSNMLKGNIGKQMLFEDSGHNLWFSTDESIGLAITSSPLSYFDKTNGIKGIIFSITIHNGIFYVGTDYGVFQKTGKETFSYVAGTRGTAMGFYSDHNKLYVAHETGILEIKGGQVRKVISHEDVQSVFPIGKSTDYFVANIFQSGIWVISRKNGIWKKKKVQGFDEDIHSLQTDSSGNVWAGSYNKGIWKIQLNDNMDSVARQVFYDVNKGLPSIVENNLCIQGNGKILATTTNGLYKYNQKADVFEPDSRFGVLLSGKIIYAMHEDPNGDIYISGKTGETGFAGILVKEKDGRYRLFTRPFMRTPWTDTGSSILATKDGAWISKHNTIFYYDKKAKTHDDILVTPYISGVKTHDSTVFSWGDKPSDITLPYSLNSVNFNFNLAFFDCAEQSQFRYQLSGLDEAWSSWTNLHEVTFNNLSAGDYILRLEARNIYGDTSMAKPFTFTIKTPFYRTFWAYGLYIAGFVLMLYALTLYNTKRIQWRNTLLEKEVGIKTRQLKAKNIAIEKQARALKDSNDTKDKLFSIISHDLRGPVNQMNEIFKLMEAGYIGKDEFTTILLPNLRERVGYVASLTDNLLHWAKDQMGGINFNPVAFDVVDIVQENINLVEVPASNKNISLLNCLTQPLVVFGDKDMIRLVLRNLISNAVKFTLPYGVIEINAQTQNRYAIISIKDTGKGLSSADIDKILGKEYFTTNGTSGEKGSGLGLMLCRDFLERNNGALMIESVPDEGSVFSFRIPVPR
jgi:signal transduction histidine kinase/ligand-binding sensor domain-containing protein